ncbi:MAG: hypothetical protein AAF668_12985, partial [Pseudomonadota bacterium]
MGIQQGHATALNGQQSGNAHSPVQPSANGLGPEDEELFRAKPIAPEAAIARLQRWREVLAEELGETPAAGTTTPKQSLAMLNVLSRTRRVAEQALVRPSLCAAVLEGRLDEALDLVLSDLENARPGSGDPGSINQIIAPIRSRIDLALDVAEIAGQRTIDQTTETRTWFVEKILEVVLERLLR